MTPPLDHLEKRHILLYRQLELRLLGAGIAVSRTSDDLVRYHDKILVIDNRTLHVLAFNLTRLDTMKSRTMGIVTRQPRLVHEAMNLFEADAARQPFVPTHADLLVSPLNARARLAKLVAAARRELWIYDPRLLDARLVRLLLQRAQAGVDVRVVGRGQLARPDTAPGVVERSTVARARDPARRA